MPTHLLFLSAPACSSILVALSCPAKTLRWSGVHPVASCADASRPGSGSTRRTASSTRSHPESAAPCTSRGRAGESGGQRERREDKREGEETGLKKA